MKQAPKRDESGGHVHPGAGRFAMEAAGEDRPFKNQTIIIHFGSKIEFDFRRVLIVDRVDPAGCFRATGHVARRRDC